MISAIEQPPRRRRNLLPGDVATLVVGSEKIRLEPGWRSQFPDGARYYHQGVGLESAIPQRLCQIIFPVPPNP